MTMTERLIIWPIGLAVLAIGAVLYLAWCLAQSVAAFVDWVREDNA